MSLFNKERIEEFERVKVYSLEEGWSRMSSYSSLRPPPKVVFWNPSTSNENPPAQLCKTPECKRILVS